MKKITVIKFLLSVAVLLNGLAAFSENAVFAQKKVVADSISSKNSEKSAEALVENSQVIIRVVGVKNFVPKEKDYLYPKDGNKFISVQIVVDNTNGLEDWDVSPGGGKIKDAIEREKGRIKYQNSFARIQRQLAKA